MKKSGLSLILSFVMPTIVCASPMVNMTDTCSCFATSTAQYAFDIDHCEKASTPRIAGVYTDSQFNNMKLVMPGITIDAPVITDYIQGYDCVGFASPGPKQYTHDGSILCAAAGLLPPIYAVPLYVTIKNSYGTPFNTDVLILLTPNELDPHTCAYTNPHGSATTSKVIKLFNGQKI